MISNDYQMPLFDRYDLSVEFERRLLPIRRTLVDEWWKYADKTEREIIDSYDCEMVCPIELSSDEAKLLEVDGCFECQVPYIGDDELWHLYPFEVVWGVLGEVFRGELLLRSAAKSATKARAEFDRRLDEICDILDHQAERIRAFENALPSVIRGELAKARRMPPLPNVKTDS